jgi:hypothetical protein
MARRYTDEFRCDAVSTAATSGRCIRGCASSWFCAENWVAEKGGLCPVLRTPRDIFEAMTE